MTAIAYSDLLGLLISAFALGLWTAIALHRCRR